MNRKGDMEVCLMGFNRKQHNITFYLMPCHCEVCDIKHYQSTE